MSEFIRETILTTRRADGSPHIAPMGVRDQGDEILLAPFRPSGTLDNLLRDRTAVINLTDDVRVYAGCLTGHWDWPLIGADRIDGIRLQDSLSHQELEVVRVDEDAVRPRIYCRIAHSVNHRPFRGFNRAQAATLEFAILVSRLGMLPQSKVDSEMQYLRIAMEKTAGEREWEAWGWLEERVQQHQGRQCATAYSAVLRAVFTWGRSNNCCRCKPTILAFGALCANRIAPPGCPERPAPASARPFPWTALRKPARKPLEPGPLPIFL